MRGGTSYIVIRGGRLLDGNGCRGDARDLLIEGDTIREVGPPGLAVPAGAVEVSAADRLIIPGLVNAHTHSDASLAKGLGDRWSLELLLNASPLTSEQFRLEDKYLAAKLAAAEMALGGITACYDLFSEFPLPSTEGLFAVGRAYADVGIRAVVAPLMADRSFWRAVPGLIEAMPDSLRSQVERAAAAPAETALATCRQALGDWPFDRDQVRPALCPSIPYHCEPEFFRACRRLADEFAVGIHTHVGESKVQAVVGFRRFGKTLTAHLVDLGVVGPDFTAAHAVWLDDDDRRRLADLGATIVHNPTSNLRLGCGIADVPAMRAAGIPVAIGTDASTCGDALNMFEAMRLGCYLSRATSPDPARWLTAEETLHMATQGGARALGFAGRLGHIEPGYKADIVFLDLARIAYLPLNNPARQVVFQENGAGVVEVMVGGRWVVKDQRLVNVDLHALRADVTRANERLARQGGDAARLVSQLEPIVASFCVGLAKEPYHVHRYVDD